MRKTVLFTLLIAAMFAWTMDAHAQDATPDTFATARAKAEATLDAAATQEAIDLTEIAGGESAVLTEQADDATKAAAIIQTAFPSPTEEVNAAEVGSQDAAQPQATAIVRQLPNAGTGNGSGRSLMLVVLVLMILATGAIAYRFRPPAR